MMEKKLSVNNLVVSFRTPGGKVQAVRDISFDLNKGETLAIVGESGSGKSVTSKSILGILAGNSIVEGGSIIYDGMDLLKGSEDDFYHILGRGISQDSRRQDCHDLSRSPVQSESHHEDRKTTDRGYASKG